MSKPNMWVKCDGCNHKFWGEDEFECLSLINAHKSKGECEKRQKQDKQFREFLKEHNINYD